MFRNGRVIAFPEMDLDLVSAAHQVFFPAVVAGKAEFTVKFSRCSCIKKSKDGDSGLERHIKSWGFEVRGWKFEVESSRLKVRDSDIDRIVDQDFLPEMGIVFYKCLVDGVVLVDFLSGGIIKKHEF